MIRDLIISNLPPHDQNKGWYRFRCPMCNDYKQRAGFNFDNDFSVYNCWNCGGKGKHHEDWETMSREMRTVLKHFNITNDAIDTALAKKFFKKLETGPAITRIQTERVFNFNPPEQPLPPLSYRLVAGASDNVWDEIANAYLEMRGMSADTYTFYLSNDPAYRERLIIPFYKGGKIIYWQARHLDDSNKVRYLNPPIDRNTVIFGFDKLYDSNVKSMFWAEGVFDALSVDGGCLLGSALSQEKIQLLARFKKDHIFIVDKDPNGYSLGCKVLALGYKITCVDGTTDDANDSVKRFGRLYTLASLVKNTMEGVEAQLFLEMYCKDNKTKSKGSTKQ
jgi:hypothetical protein